jgi:hypothetical protein
MFFLQPIILRSFKESMQFFFTNGYLSSRFENFAVLSKNIHYYFDNKNFIRYTAGNRHKQNSWFCKEIREDNFRFWWRRVHEDASQGMYISKTQVLVDRTLCCSLFFFYFFFLASTFS